MPLHSRSLFAGALVSSAAVLLACTGDDTVVAPADAGADASLGYDAEGFETGAFDATEIEGDSGNLGADAGAPPPARLLLSNSTTTQSELAVFGIHSGTVDGRLVYPGALGASVATSSSPWLLEQMGDLVARLDPIQPWIVRSTWNVALGDATDAGFAVAYSYPDAIVLGAGTNAYVLRYTRNRVAVIDTSIDVDGGIPSSTIDLSAQVQAGGDGYVEMTAGSFDPTSNLAYVLLGNLNRFDVASDGHTLLCASTHPTVVAIDTTQNTLAPFGDAGAGGVVLQGYAPPLGPSSMVFDPAGDRLLVIESGCNAGPTDAGPGFVIRREIEAVSLVDGSVTQLLDLTTQSPPSALFYVDQHHVIVQLAAGAFMWDPASTTLGAAIPGAPESFALDGLGNLVGVASPGEGGAGAVSVVSVDPTDGGVTLLGQNPFMLTGGTVGGVQMWPAP